MILVQLVILEPHSMLTSSTASLKLQVVWLTGASERRETDYPRMLEHSLQKLADWIFLKALHEEIPSSLKKFSQKKLRWIEQQENSFWQGG